MHATLIGEMAVRRVSIADISDLLGIHRNSVRNKLYGISEFTITQAIAIFTKFFSDCDFIALFKKSEHMPQ